MTDQTLHQTLQEAVARAFEPGTWRMLDAAERQGPLSSRMVLLKEVSLGCANAAISTTLKWMEEAPPSREIMNAWRVSLGAKNDDPHVAIGQAVIFWKDGLAAMRKGMEGS